MSAAHDPEKMLCYCLGVRYGTVAETIREHGCRRVEQVTKLCRAGGGCRSCHPEIAELIESVRNETDATSGLRALLGRIFSPRDSQ